MDPSPTHPQPSHPSAPPASRTDATPSDAYRAGLERAMSLVWHEKQKHSVITPAYFALAKVWDELYHEAHPKTDGAH